MYYLYSLDKDAFISIHGVAISFGSLAQAAQIVTLEEAEAVAHWLTNDGHGSLNILHEIQ